MALLGFIRINEELCKGCELCVNACPRTVLHLDAAKLTSRGYHPAALTGDGCSGCATCAVVCPEAAIVVYRKGRDQSRKAVRRTSE